MCSALEASRRLQVVADDGKLRLQMSELQCTALRAEVEATQVRTLIVAAAVLILMQLVHDLLRQ